MTDLHSDRPSTVETVQREGVEVYAWLRDNDDDLWLLTGLRPDGEGGLYALGGFGPAHTISHLQVMVGVGITGPTVTL
jgi:hypothetical protein